MILKKVAAMSIPLLLAVALAPTMRAQEYANEANVLLQRIEANAVDVRENAAKLKTYARFPGEYDWQVHADQLGRIRADVNSVADLLGQFEKNKDEVMMRQDKAVNFIIPEAAELSNSVEEAIHIVNNQKQKLEVGHPEYNKQINAIYDHADKIVAAVGLAESAEEIQAAQQKLMSQNR